MGFYINKTSTENILHYSYQEKIDAIVFDGGFIIEEPQSWSYALVCIVDNGWMSAAGYAFNENEMNVMKEPDKNNRPKTWLKYEKAMEMSGYDGNKRIHLSDIKK